MQNKKRKLSLNQETLWNLTHGGKTAITRTCLISLCLQDTCVGVQH